MLVLVDKMIVSLVIKMELVRVTESPVAMEDVVSAEPRVSEIKLHRETMEHTQLTLCYIPFRE